MPMTRAASEKIIRAAQERAAQDSQHLEQFALVCDLFSRIEIPETRDLVASVTAFALQGSSGAQQH